MRVKLADSQKTFSNPFKRADVFRCTHLAHKNFGFRISAYHVLCEKKCYPDGCIEFRWHCQLLKRGGRCHRGFKFVGKDCSDCRYFDEEKIQRVPKLLISPERYDIFNEDLREFDLYFQGLQRRSIEFSGTIIAANPYIVNGLKSGNCRFHGYLSEFENGYFGIDRINDNIYARIETGLQQRSGFRSGDKIDFTCYAGLDRGRIILRRIRNVNIIERGDGPVWDYSRAKVAAASGKFLEKKYRRCMRCQMGLLVDNSNNGCDESGRKLFCLQGVDDPLKCVYDIYAKFLR